MAKEIFEKKNYEVRVTHVDKGYEVEKELENNLWADIIFIQTPIYWFNIPGKFKSYIDKIYTIGNAGSMSNGDGRTRSDLSKKYGSGGLLTGTVNRGARTGTMYGSINKKTGVVKNKFVKKSKANLVFQVSIKASSSFIPARPFLGINYVMRRRYERAILNYLNHGKLIMK